MKNAIRCCISCILPCGALDVIRIVHSNGYVEEISGRTVFAADVMRAHPKHVLKKPSSPSDHDSVVPTKIVVVPPDAELQRGKIYFLMPVTKSSSSKAKSSGAGGGSKKRRESHQQKRSHSHSHSRGGEHRSSNHDRRVISGNDDPGRCPAGDNCGNSISLLISDRYLSEILSEKLSTQRERRRGRVGVWRPHLESISESLNDD